MVSEELRKVDPNSDLGLSMKAAVRDVGVLLWVTRETQKQAEVELDAKLEELKPLLADLEERYKTARLETERVTAQLRAIALDYYTTTGEKKFPGGQIKDGFAVLYDEKKAISWAIEHKMCLLLDEKGFQKLAKGNLLPIDGSDYRWLELQETHTPFIDSDLSKLIEMEMVNADHEA